jgi:hypothetical protein
MVELAGPNGAATGEVVAVDGEMVTVHVTGDVRPATPGGLVADAPGALPPEPAASGGPGVQEHLADTMDSGSA